MISVGGCSNSNPSDVCTALFASIPVTMVDVDGHLFTTPMVVHDTVLRTHQGFVVEQLAIQPGTAMVFSDTWLDAVRPSGDSVAVVGSSTDDVGFRATFVFGSDGCHVSKLRGPDTVVVKSQRRPDESRFQREPGRHEIP